MRKRIVVLLASLIAAAGVSLSVGTSVASAACDTNWWNLGCQFYSPAEGHTGTEFCCSASESVYSTFDTTNFLRIKYILTTAGGSWLNSVATGNGSTFTFTAQNPGSDKVGCYNHNSGTLWVNCRHYNP
jgi:hypothetical protein